MLQYAVFSRYRSCPYSRERAFQKYGFSVTADLAARVEFLLQLLHAHAAGARERTDVVSLLGDEVRMAHREFLVRVLLLTQPVKRHRLVGRAIDDDVIAYSASGPDADDLS